jgi:hypothetical protein
MMAEDEFDRLVWSIRKIGQVDPIVRDEDGRILDGRCRFKACEIAKVEPRLALPKDAVKAHLFAKNVARRHLTQGQRAVILALLIKENFVPWQGRAWWEKEPWVSDGSRDDGFADFILSTNFVRRHLTKSQLHLADAMVEEPDYPEHLVTPEARLIVRYPYIVQQVRDGVLTLAKAHELAIVQEQESAKQAEDQRRLVQLRSNAPFLAALVDERELTLDQAIATAEEQAVAPVLHEHAEAIRAAGKRVIADLIEIGGRLIECKRLVGHGNWLPWLEREFKMSADTAERFMSLHRLQGQIPHGAESQLPVGGLYLLAKPSTPETVRDDVFRRAGAGEALSVAEIRQAIDQARGKSPVHKPDRLRELCERMSAARPDDPLVQELHALLFDGNDAT